MSKIRLLMVQVFCVAALALFGKLTFADELSDAYFAPVKAHRLHQAINADSENLVKAAGLDYWSSQGYHRVEDLASIKKLLQSGADINYVNTAGDCAVLAALRAHNWEIASYLILQKASFSGQDSEGNSIVHYLIQSARWLKSVPALQNILDKASPSDFAVQNSKGETPVHALVRRVSDNDDEQVVPIYEAYISSLPSSVFMIQDNNGDLPLHLAARAGRKNLFERLLKKYPVGLLVFNKKGQSPAHVAASFRVTSDQLWAWGYSEKRVMGDWSRSASEFFHSNKASILNFLIEKFPEVFFLKSKDGAETPARVAERTYGGGDPEWFVRLQLRPLIEGTKDLPSQTDISKTIHEKAEQD